jgi:hypothetical protein
MVNGRFSKQNTKTGVNPIPVVVMVMPNRQGMMRGYTCRCSKVLKQSLNAISMVEVKI